MWFLCLPTNCDVLEKTAETPRHPERDAGGSATVRDFFRLYLRARLLGTQEVEIADAFGIFSAEGISALRQRISDQALKTPVVLTERLSNRVFAIHLVMGAEERVIALNTRFRVDPDYLIHALLEEFAHAQQVLNSVDFEAQRIAFAYAERPYELEA